MRKAKSKPSRHATSLVKRELLKIDGRNVEIIARTNPRARRYIVKVDPSTGEVSVVSPSSRSLDRALDFARKERSWIADRLADIPVPVPLEIGAPILLRGVEYVVRSGETASASVRRGPVWIDRDSVRPTLRVGGLAEHAPRRVLDWMKREARTRIDEKVGEYATLVGVRPKRVTIRDTSSRWGSCSSTRSLSFSWRLIMAPPYVLDYVVAHEICHLREMNHGPRFWRLCQALIPSMEKPQAWLSDNGAWLHRYAPRRAT